MTVFAQGAVERGGENLFEGHSLWLEGADGVYLPSREHTLPSVPLITLKLTFKL